MLFIDNKGVTDPAINLALEEYVLRHLPMEDSYLLFYINEPSIIIGKNQNTIEEINEDYVREKHIHVVRRISGGGAVYHDLGNLNFSFLTRDDGKSFHNFAKFTEPVVQALQAIGVDASLSGRNDIQVGERKISGNAMFSTKGRMFSHGTLLFNSAMEEVVSALKVKPMKIESKGTKSIRSRVANITEFLDQPMTMECFRETLLRHLFQCEPQDVPEHKLSEEDWKNIHQLAEDKYRSWEWNYGESPKYNIQNAYKFPSGIIDVRLHVAQGMIDSLTIFGDFFGVQDVSELEQRLAGIRYTEEAVNAALSGMDLTPYFGKISVEEFIKLLFVKDLP